MKYFVLFYTLAFLFACPLGFGSAPAVDFVEIVKHNFSDAQKAKLAEFLPVMNKTMAGQCFGDFMLERKLVQANGKSNKEVLEHLRSSKVKVELISYWSLSGTIGYTYPDVNKIWLNNRIQSGFTPCESASNLAHEASHKIGYGHDFYATDRRPYSVPYSINAAFNKCCNDGTEKVRVCSRSWKTLWLKKTCKWIRK